MDKETILNYVTETPGNTNRAVLESMLEGMNGIEMVTLFDDDINFTYVTSQYGPAYGRTNINIPVDTVDVGFILATYEDDHYFGIINNAHYLSVNEGLTSPQLPFIRFNLQAYSSEDTNHVFSIYSNESSSSELEAYCQESHHLKIEWFII